MAKLFVFNSTSLSILHQLLGLLRPGRKALLFSAFILISISALFELAIVVLTAPLILLIQGQTSASSNIQTQLPFVHYFYNDFSQLDFTGYVLFFATLVLLSAAVRSYSSYYSGRVAALISADISTSAYIRIYNQSLEKLLAKPFDYYTSLLTSYTDNISLTLTFLLQGLSGLVSVFFIVAGLLMIDFHITVAILSLLITSYIAISVFSKRGLSFNSKLIATQRVSILKKLQESFSLSRQTLLASNQSFYTSSYFTTESSLREKLAQNIFIGNYPRFIVESIGLILIAISALYLSFTQKSALTFAIIGSTALGMQRLLPSFQQVYTGLSTLRSNQKCLSEVFCYASGPGPGPGPGPASHYPVVNTESTYRSFNRLEFYNVSYSFPGSNSYSLSNISCELQVGESIGLVGPTGSGKSTFIELLCGLRRPSCGQILLDDLDLYSSENANLLKQWRSKVAYVPQKTFICNSTIAENIALGVPRELINIERLEYAASRACMFDFINSLPLGFETVVGDSGWSLSGGQAQRLGLARAFYMQPELLILDEVTSSLDLHTEKLVVSSLQSLHSTGVTLISIAHRPAALSLCNRLVRLSSGSLLT